MAARHRRRPRMRGVFRSGSADANRRRLIRRVKTDLDGLTAAERAQIEGAVATVRTTGRWALGMPRSRPRLPDVGSARPA